MMKQSYIQRVKQRRIYFKLGMSLVGIGFFLLAAMFITKQFQLLQIALFLIICGAIFALIISRVGWSCVYWRDLIFNQISIVSIVFGLGLAAFAPSINPIGAILILIGILLIFLGSKFHSKVDNLPEDEKLKEWW